MTTNEDERAASQPRESRKTDWLVAIAALPVAGAFGAASYVHLGTTAWFAGATTVGLTSGASVPEILVRGVLSWLAERGWAEVEEVSSAEEHLIFALPPELRRDLKAAGKA